MSDPLRDSAYSGLRHLFTSARDGALGAPGFQTVACAEKLMPGLKVIESLVRGYRGDRGIQRCRQFVPLATDLQYGVLTTFVPSGLCPDGRPGNYLAESWVVPTAWLESSDWDLEMAFASLEWSGPESLQNLDAWPCELPPVPLASLAPGALDRLGQLVAAVPERLLAPLVHAVVQQALAPEPLAVLAPLDADPTLLDALVPLLPLLLPPRARLRELAGEVRPLSFRTQGGDGEPKVDIEGLLAGRSRPRGQVIDLGGRLPPRASRASASRYVEWLLEVLRGSRWAELESYYEQASTSQDLAELFGVVDSPGPQASTRSEEELTLSTRRPKEPKSNPTSPKTTPGSEALRQRGELWSARQRAEGEAWDLERRFEADTDQLLKTVATEVDALRQRFQSETERHLRSVRQQREDAGSNVQQAATEAVESLGRQADQAEQEIGKIFAARHKRLEERGRSAIRDLRQQSDEISKDIRRELETSLERLVEDGAKVRRLIASLDESPRRSGRSGGWSLTASRRQGWLPYMLAAVVIAAASFLAWRYWPLGFGGGDPTPATATAPPPPSRAAVYSQALGRFSEGSSAATVLRRAVAKPELANLASASYLKLTLADRKFDAAIDCSLLQAALSESQPIAIDGSCGPGTVRTLREVTAGSCCDGKLWLAAKGVESDLAACFVGRYLQGGKNATAGCSDDRWPFRPGRGWQLQEAIYALRLYRLAAGSPSAAALADQDLAVNAGLADQLAGKQLSQADAVLILRLAHLTSSGGEDLNDVRVEDLRRQDLEAVMGWLDEP